MKYDVILVGGGAAGFFTAINLAEQNKKLRIAILERGKEVLSKVRISGGGRCNVTHACFDPRELVQFYPRGEKELLGPFHQFCSGDTISWFAERGVNLKIEEDGRMFPDTDSSETIINCFLGEAKRLKIDIITGVSVQSFFKKEDTWKLDTSKGGYECCHLVITTGSNPKIWGLMQEQGHSIVEPVPSLFTFNVKDKRIKDLMGIAVPAEVKVKGTKLEASGPLLITHWGMSGPAVLRLSAWGARILADKKYQFCITVNWVPQHSRESIFEDLQEVRKEQSKKNVIKRGLYDLSNRLWERIVLSCDIAEDAKWADLNNKHLQVLSAALTEAEYQVNGKSTFKDEFVTAGGIDLKEINFKTMESRIQDNLYFAGEVMNIDAITGGFNFQNAWTTSYIAALTIANKNGESDEV
ncbi:MULTISPECIES: NAD(P)/FAD-dependent oxidoreductase [Myroides]|uniref:Aminoacetone oxidase family FAD-binding enzyme n=1 Tax=Myroides albus TaxID=2562892 RepID=A0A6I3LEQ8_9FLAO|nr:MULTISPECIES: NAD(P)/FAD-dependent oxidoreductase [Myroides]MTG96958.1 aminoacetone oxidase family FAD-binding enzyme [Myroides albus]MVX35349.1 aminoacetone oxidase family FAD-binding enzyme [Myroides sp. LoEW2-1]UVD78290.1 NAD(P)/FAD-dependent oxidoreductase [Myroides albus]